VLKSSRNGTYTLLNLVRKKPKIGVKLLCTMYIMYI